MMAALLVLLSVAFSDAQETSWFTEPPAPGPFTGLSETDLASVPTFTPDQPVIGTYLFYWYDVYSGAHLVDHDGTDACTTHPPSWEDYSFHSTRWWREQLKDIAAAGIDFAAPVYWGFPNGYDGWSFAGLPHLVRACDYMARIGEACPRIALFYDTSTLVHNGAGRRIDLSTAEGKDWFYCTIRDFFSFIPPRHWAAIGGRPIILLYAAAFAAQQDPALFPHVRERFKKDFGVDPYIIKQNAWQGEADSVCEWGGALGLNISACAALGPGYDHSAVPGRTPLVRDREDGAFYSRSWETLLKLNPTRRPKLVMVETWNEFHEGTDVAESAEYGRQYINLTRKYADLFHSGERVEMVAGPFSNANTVALTLGPDGKASGLRIPSQADGQNERAQVAGRACIRTRTTEWAIRYLYVDLDDSFVFDADPRPYTVEFDYLDEGPVALELHYDSQDPEGSVRAGAFKPGGRVEITGSGEWKTARLTVQDARFANRTNGADLRIAVFGPGELCVSRMSVTRD